MQLESRTLLVGCYSQSVEHLSFPCSVGPPRIGAAGSTALVGKEVGLAMQQLRPKPSQPQEQWQPPTGLRRRKQDRRRLQKWLRHTSNLGRLRGAHRHSSLSPKNAVGRLEAARYLR